MAWREQAVFGDVTIEGALTTDTITFSNNGTLAMSGPLGLKSYTVATVPAAASYTGNLIYVSNGAAGNPVVAFSNGTNWLRVDTLATVSAT